MWGGDRQQPAIANQVPTIDARRSLGDHSVGIQIGREDLGLLAGALGSLVDVIPLKVCSIIQFR